MRPTEIVLAAAAATLLGCNAPNNQIAVPYAELRPHVGPTPTRAITAPDGSVRVTVTPTGMSVEMDPRLPGEGEPIPEGHTHVYDVYGGVRYNRNGLSASLGAHPRNNMDILTSGRRDVVYEGRGVGVMTEQLGDLNHASTFEYDAMITADFVENLAVHTATDIREGEQWHLSDRGEEVGLPIEEQLLFDGIAIGSDGDLRSDEIHGRIDSGYAHGVISDTRQWNDGVADREHDIMAVFATRTSAE